MGIQVELKNNLSILHIHIFFLIGETLTREGAPSSPCLIKRNFKHVSLLYRIYKIAKRDRFVFVV